MPEETTNAIVNVGDIAKPVDTFIRKVSNALGSLYAPFHIKRVAKAEAEAAIIKAKADIQITELHRRAMYRFFEEEANRQKNIEEITSKAIPQLTENTKPDAMEDDWVTNFFDKSRIVSDTQMQELWSKVLAGEANAPGTYSKRTVNFLSDLDKNDAELFVKLCSFCWNMGDMVPLVFDSGADIYNRNGVTFNSLSHLESIGLIQFNNVTEFSRLKLPKYFALEYYGRPLAFEMANDTDNRLRIGRTLLTKIGQELASICGSTPVDGFWEYVQARWRPHLLKNDAAQGAAPNGDPATGSPSVS